jgi:hypothetical protein
VTYKTQYFGFKPKACTHALITPLSVVSLIATNWTLSIPNGCIYLAHDVFIRKMLEKNRPGGAFGIAKAVSFAKYRVNHCFFPLFG